MSAQQPQPSKYSNFYSGVRTVSGLSTGPIKSPKTSIFLPFSLSCFHYWQGVRDLWKLVPDKGFDIKAGVRNNNISYIEWVGVYPVSAKAYFKKFCQLLSECGSGIYGYFPGVLLFLNYYFSKVLPEGSFGGMVGRVGCLVMFLGLISVCLETLDTFSYRVFLNTIPNLREKTCNPCFYSPDELRCNYSFQLSHESILDLKKKLVSKVL